MLLAASCTLPMLDLSGKGCPCTSAFVCVDGRCVAPDTVMDAASDAYAPEEGSPIDGSDSASSAFCAAHVGATFCADFDSSDAPWGWDSTSAWGGGQIGVDPALSVSPSKSASFALPVLKNTDQANATLVKGLPAAVQTKIAIELDVLIQALDAANSKETYLVTLALGNTAGKDEVHLAIRDGAARVIEIVTPSDGGAPVYAGGDLPVGLPVSARWQHITWTITRTATSSTSNVIVPEEDGGYITGVASLNFYRFNVPPKLAVGLSAVSAPSAGFQIRVDNVLVNVD